MYAYGANNPIKYTDPDGNDIEDYRRFESTCKTVGAIKGMITGAKSGYVQGAIYGLKNDTLCAGIYATVGSIVGAVKGIKEGIDSGARFASSIENYNGPQRDARNQEYFAANPFDPNNVSDFKKFSDSEAAFHQVPGSVVGKFETLEEDKYGGRAEIVWDYTLNSEVVSPKERGTYNYGHGFVQHGIKDVLPWIILGTGENDPSTMKDRSADFLNSIPNYIKGKLDDK